MNRHGPRTDLQDGESVEQKKRRARMVEEQIVARGVTDPVVLEAVRTVPRHRFVPFELSLYAHDDRPVPIGFGQTISQPYIVAYMTAVLGLKPDSKVLEVGTGCGYQAAILATIAGSVDTVEILTPLYMNARERLARSGFERVRVHRGDGGLGWPEGAPYDAIIVSCGAPRVPPALLEQLAPGGRLVCPVTTGPDKQELVLVAKGSDGSLDVRSLIPVRFVPLTGPSGKAEPPPA